MAALQLWDLVWESPGQWWDDQLEQAGDFALALRKAHDRIIGTGCPPVDLYTALRRLQKEMSIPSSVWQAWGDNTHQTLENLWHVRTASPDDFLSEAQFASTVEALRKVASICERERLQRKGQKDAGWHRLLDQCLDDLLKRTGGRFPAAEFALLIRHATARPVTGASLRMLRSRRGKRLPPPQKLRRKT